MKHTITFRQAQLDDYLQLTRYINELSAERTYIRLQGKQLTEDEEIQYLTDFIQKMKDKTAVKLFAFDKDTLIGAADVTLGFGAEKHIGLFGITIKKSYRGKGIGTELLHRTIQLAIDTLPDLEIVTLSVFGDNNLAKQMYLKAGFIHYGTLPNGVVRNGTYADHEYMYLPKSSYKKKIL